MGFQEKNGVVTVHAKLTDLGKKYLLTDQSRFNISQFAPFDDEVDYTLWNIYADNGVTYFGQSIEALPLLEPVASNIHQAKYSLIRNLDRNVIRMPIFIISPTSVTLDEIDSDVTVHVQIQNVDEPNIKVLLLDRTKADVNPVGGGGSEIDVNPLAVQNFIGQSGFSYAKAFVVSTSTPLVVTPERNENDFNVETKIIIVGASTNARSEIPVTIKPNTTITT